MSGEPWVVSKFWRLECCLSASLLRPQVLTDTIYKWDCCKVNSLTILLARLSWLCRKDEAQGTEGEVWREHTSVCDRSRIPKATQRFAFMQQSQIGVLANAIEVLLYIIGARHRDEALEKKLLRKFGGFKKLSYLCTRNSKERVVGSVRYMIGDWWRRQLIETLAELTYWLARETGQKPWEDFSLIQAFDKQKSIGKKTSPKIWWFQKVVVPLHSQLQRKGGRKCPIHGWSLVTMMVDRNACGVYMVTHSSSRSRDSMRCLLKRVSDRWKSIGEKTSPKIWWFQKLVVPLHSQPIRKGSSLFTCEEVLSWSF